MRESLKVTRWPSWWAFVAATVIFVAGGMLRTCSVMVSMDPSSIEYRTHICWSNHASD